MDQRLTFMTLGVADVDRARTFYESLGWSGESPDGDIYLFQMNGMVLGLWNRQKLADDCCVQDSGGWGGVQLTHNVGSREEVDAIMGEAEAAGATIGRPAEVQPWGATPASSTTSTATPGRSCTSRGGSSRRTEGIRLH